MQKGDQMVTLTKAEERIMQILWDLERGFIKDIQEQFPDLDRRRPEIGADPYPGNGWNRILMTRTIKRSFS